ncbi:MAG: dTMP kinase [Chloroflexi bacterium]|nr:dTMP kinase [Chloroflexota bacterium]
MFITLEGPEGCGKTTQAARLAEFLRARGWETLLTREPGGTPIGEQIRAVLGSLENEAMLPRTEILLFQASRAQLVEQIIRPHLEQGGVVVCDRYADSTLAYQGYGHRMDLAELNRVVAYATGGLKPDLTLLLDIDVEQGLLRRARGGEWNRLDAYKLDFHRRVRQGYHCLAQAEPQRWVVIDASPPPDDVQAALRRAVEARLASPPAA